MPKRALIMFSAALCLAVPSLARAADEMEAWSPTDTAIRATTAGISLPQTIASLSLTKSGEASNGGRAVDNYAQYLSEDGAIQATLYVYLPTYADASLAAYMTDKAIMERFGSRTRRTAYASAPVAGKADSAIRAVYDDAADGALTTAAGFVHAGRWIVKIRVTGPTERRTEVLAGLDGMLAGLTLDDPASLHATGPARFDSCPAADIRDARLTKDDTTPAPPQDVRIPREGKDALCIRGTVTTAEGRYDMLQQAGRSDGAIIVPVDDSGTVLAFDPAAQGKGYKLSIHMVGQTDLYGVYDRVPSPRQIAAILDGKDPQTAKAEATAAYAANGDVTMVQSGTAR
ncbi:hypothetical protein EBBID32_37270 [Sphingobium indicum BiD32]|uniref:Uncharacterized protein n=1 Tax=Sphingobium indicum BiD32 TaxID=1301087 RepID=N1MQY6_9SPHN|nr:hypothetical protein [Sphingobium indicum]CCW19361.1 hypothetical protein EBBID32_37270 [Sphingobium indicum BiD32]